MGPDGLFTAEQQRRLAELIARWRTAQPSESPLDPAEHAELAALVEAELISAIRRSAALANTTGH